MQNFSADYRPLTASLSEVADLIAEVISATAPTDKAATMIANCTNVERLERILAERTWFEARVDGRLVGVACVHLTTPTTAYLSSHYIRLRRRGIGSALTTLRLDWAREQGATTASATTHLWNTASLANLASAGFQVVGESPDLWAPPGVIVELVRSW